VPAGDDRKPHEGSHLVRSKRARAVPEARSGELLAWTLPAQVPKLLARILASSGGPVVSDDCNARRIARLHSVQLCTQSAGGHPAQLAYKAILAERSKKPRPRAVDCVECGLARWSPFQDELLQRCAQRARNFRRDELSHEPSSACSTHSATASARAAASNVLRLFENLESVFFARGRHSAGPHVRDHLDVKRFMFWSSCPVAALRLRHVNVGYQSHLASPAA